MTHRRVSRRLPLASLLVGLVGPLGGCAAHPVAPSTGPGQAETKLRDVASPKVCLPKRRLLEALHQESVLERAYADVKGEPVVARSRATEPSIGGAYTAVAPATVLIRTHEAMGSGVIVDARGLVLTNHHVVDEFLQPDLTIKVTLELNEVGPTGHVERTGKTYTGVVVKSDPVKDIALVKIDDPPPNLPVARLADLDPEIGEEALSIGNAGIGLLWAAKTCNVSKIGDVTRETSMLQVADCSLKDPGAEPEEAARAAQQCEARKKEIKEDVERAAQGLAIQTTCNLNGGDSGGPLVNAYGEVIGLNQSIRFGGSSLAFHVHVAELRAFLTDAGVEPATVVPDPWCEGGVDPIAEDADGDGKVDLVIATREPAFRDHDIVRQATYLIDLDGAATTPTLARPFGADVAILMKDGAAFAFYDEDGDGQFDTLLRDRKADGTPETAFRLADGRATIDPALLTKHTLDARKLGASALAVLGERIGALGLGKLAAPEIVALGKTPRVPDWRHSMGKRMYVSDADDDGKGDSLFAVGDDGTSGMLIAPDSPELTKLKEGDDGSEALASGAIRPSMVAFSRPNGRWALYDTDADGTLDLSLFAQAPEADEDEPMMMREPDVVTFAVRTVDGATRPEPTALGRSLMRADLLPKQRSFARRFMGRDSAVVRASVPDPKRYGLRSEPWALVPLEKERQVLMRDSKNGRSILVDLDRDSKKLATGTAEELAAGDAFDAEVAFRTENGMAWAYYDTDADGVFDHLYFSLDASSGKLDNALVTNGSGEEIRADSTEGGLFRPELLKSLSPASKKALEKLFEEMSAKAKRTAKED